MFRHRKLILFICTIIAIIFFYFFNLRLANAETIIFDKYGSTMICNVYGEDYFTNTSGNVTTCTNNGTYAQKPVWNNTILGFNLISTRINYNLQKGYTYKFVIGQNINWVGGRYYTQTNKPERARIVLANNSTNFDGVVKLRTSALPGQGENEDGTIYYDVTITPKQNSSYFDLDVYYMGTGFTGVDFTSISSDSIYTDSVPEYSTEQGVDDIINNQNNNTQDIINNQNNNTQNIINNQNENADKINDTINNDNVDIPDGYFDDITNNMPMNKPISRLVTLPVTLYKRLANSVVATCTPYSLGTLYGHELVLPCIKPNTYLKKPIWNFVSAVSTSFLLYYMAKFYYNIFLTIANLKEGKDID